MDVLAWLEEPLRFTLFQRSLLALLLVGALSGVVGSFVVVRGIAFLGDAIAHSLTPGVAFAILLSVDIVLGALAAALLAVGFIIWISRSERLSETSAIGIVMSAMLALGIAIISRSANYQTDLTHLLFGSPLGISQEDLLLILALGLPVIAVIALFFKELQLVSFDPLLAESIKLPARALSALLLVLVAITVVASLRTLGIGLMLAMLVTPATTARLFTKRLLDMILVAVLLGMISALAGFYAAYYLALPTASAVVLVATLFFAVSLLYQRIRVWRAGA